MSVLPLKKVYLLSHLSLREEVIETLHQEGVLEVTDLNKELGEEPREEALEEALRQIEFSLSKVHFVSSILSSFEEKKGFLRSLIREKARTTRQKFDLIAEKLDFEKLYNQIEDLDTNLVTLKNKLNSIRTAKASLKPWESLTLRLEEIRETKETSILSGELPPAALSSFKKRLDEEIPESGLEVVSRDSRGVRIILLSHKERLEEVRALSSSFGFREVSFEEFRETPTAEILKLEREGERAEKEITKILGELKKLTFLKPDLIILRGFLEDKKRKLSVRGRFAQTQETFMLEGWIPKEKVKGLSDRIGRISPQLDLAFFEPSPGENPPVVLKNNRLFRPYELLTRLYGLPNYTELDPTPFIALFFTLFFGFALGDAGYGLVLALASWWLKKRLDLSPNTQDFFKILIYGGFASGLVGAITGGYFSIPVKSLPSFLRALIIFDPLEGVILFLVLTCALGVVHVLLGVALAGLNNIRNHRLTEALFDQFSTLVFVLSFIFWVTLALFQILSPEAFKPIEKVYSFSKNLLMATVFGVVFLQGRVFLSKSVFDIIKRIFSGLYALYGMSAFVGNILSYVRLLALGLATVLIGMVINLLATQALAIPVLGVILMLAILLIGHIFNLVINILGAIVHPLRLQYVEFFGQFYQGGGRKFEPLGLETKNIIFTDTD